MPVYRVSLEDILWLDGILIYDVLHVDKQRGR